MYNLFQGIIYCWTVVLDCCKNTQRKKPSWITMFLSKIRTNVVSLTMKRNIFLISLSTFLHCEISFESLCEWRGLLRKHSCPCSISLTVFPADVSVRTLCVRQLESVLYSSRYLRSSSLESPRQQRETDRLSKTSNSHLLLCLSQQPRGQREQGHFHRRVQTVSRFTGCLIKNLNHIHSRKLSFTIFKKHHSAFCSLQIVIFDL